MMYKYTNARDAMVQSGPVWRYFFSNPEPELGLVQALRLNPKPPLGVTGEGHETLSHA